jgi:uncharacterized membrane protein YdjX (TVP38/TMEM64 family)
MRALSHSGLATQLSRAARISVAPPSWDLLLRSCAVAAVAATLVSLLFPGVSDLAVYFTLMLICCGPTSAFLPAASEPVLIAFGQLYSPLLIAGIGIVAIVLVEFLNYSVFDAILHSEKLTKLRDAGIVQLVVRWFNAQPFATVAVAALTPIPFWIARTCAVLSRYSVFRYMCATAMGRFVRIFLIAALGSALPLTTGQIAAAGATAMALIVAVVLLRRLQLKQRRALSTV